MVGVGSRFVTAGSTSNSAGEDAEYDPRSLYEKLQSQKEAKDARYDEMFKLSNQFRGIDEDESDFLARIKQQRQQQEQEKQQKEKEQLEAFRNAQKSNPTMMKHDEKKQEKEKNDNKVKKKRKNDSAALLGIKRKKPAQATSTSTSTGDKADKPTQGDAKKT